MTSNDKKKNIIITITKSEHELLKQKARKEGRTITGMIKMALYKIFKIKFE